LPQSLAPFFKRLEVAGRKLSIRALTRMLARARAPERPDWGARPHRVLFLRHDRIGDMILSTGLLRAIATSHPTISLHVLASPANAPVLRADPNVDAVIVFDRTKPARYLAMLRQLRRSRYDAVIDCMPTAPSLTTLLLMWASGATHRIGVAGRGNDAAMTLPVPPRPEATHIADQLGALAAAFGVDPATTSFHPTIYLDEAERARASTVWNANAATPDGRRFLLNISAGRAFRRWPDERYVAVIKHVLARDPRLTVFVIAAPNERERAESIARSAGVRFEQTPTLREALTLVATADMLFTPDTGLAHAASAFGRPTVVMYVRGTATQWSLYGSAGHQLSSPDGTLESLRLEPVLRAVDHLLAETERTHSDAAGNFDRFVR
jgi:ADP-heptose:LPS heptosyltransferase